MSEFHFAWIESRRDSSVFGFWFSCFGFCFAEFGFWFAVCGFWFVDFFGFWFADFGVWFAFFCFWFLVSDSRVFVSDSCILVSDSPVFWFLIRRVLVSDSRVLVSDSRVLVFLILCFWFAQSFWFEVCSLLRDMLSFDLTCWRCNRDAIGTAVRDLDGTRRDRDLAVPSLCPKPSTNVHKRAISTGARCASASAKNMIYNLFTRIHSHKSKGLSTDRNVIANQRVVGPAANRDRTSLVWRHFHGSKMVRKEIHKVPASAPTQTSMSHLWHSQSMLITVTYGTRFRDSINHANSVKATREWKLERCIMAVQRCQLQWHRFPTPQPAPREPIDGCETKVVFKRSQRPEA